MAPYARFVSATISTLATPPSSSTKTSTKPKPRSLIWLKRYKSVPNCALLSTSKMSKKFDQKKKEDEIIKLQEKYGLAAKDPNNFNFFRSTPTVPDTSDCSLVCHLLPLEYWVRTGIGCSEVKRVVKITSEVHCFLISKP